MRDFSLTSSDHILAQGIKFWTSVVEDDQIEELDQCYQIITAIGQFLTTLNFYKETVDTMENDDREKLDNVQSFPLSVMKNDDPVKTDDKEDDNQSCNNEKNEKTQIKDVKEVLKMDDQTGENDKDSDADLDDLFNVIECSDDLLDDVLPGGVITGQEEGNCPELRGRQ